MKTIEEKCAERREEKAAIAERKKAKRVGRPKKKKLPVGRPKGQEAIMKEYRMRMLNSPNSPYVLQKIMEAAMNDDHKHQAAAWKIWADRVMPLGGFDAKNKEGAKIEINISTFDKDKPATAEPAIDVEFESVEYSDE